MHTKQNTFALLIVSHICLLKLCCCLVFSKNLIADAAKEVHGKFKDRELWFRSAHIFVEGNGILAAGRERLYREVI